MMDGAVLESAYLTKTIADAESIKGATDLLSGKSRMTEANTKSALRDIRRALLPVGG